MKPRVYLLCGLPGTGKSTYAEKNLVSLHTKWYSSDEWIIKLFGREFNPHDYANFEIRAKDKIKDLATQDIEKGENVILDFGFWKKAEREKYIQWAHELNATPIIYYFKASLEEMKHRLKNRNVTNPNALIVTDIMLAEFIKQFEKPEKSEASIVYID